MKTAIFVGAVSVLGIVAAITLGKAPSAAEPKAPSSPWVQVRLIEQPTVELQGTWLSHEAWEWPEEDHFYDESGAFQSAEGIQLSEDVIVVDEASVRAVLESGEVTSVGVPSDCRISLRWKAEDSSIWWHDPETDPSCWVQTSTPLDETVRLTSTMIRSNEQSQPGYFGRVLIDDSGQIIVGCLDHELGAASCAEDAAGATSAVLVAEHESGNVYFWAVLR